MAMSRNDPRKTYLTIKGKELRNALDAKARIENELGLKLDGWTVLWYQPGDPDMIIEFLTPDMKQRTCGCI